ncbi:MAG: hypothetical protein AB1689_20220 [Thermodesulfobacteriota bacterium]
MEYSAKDKRIYLRLGDRVTHIWHEEWGEGAVVEERTSIVPGGTCLVRLLFEDGQQRTFNNDLDNEQCCYFFGLRRIQSFDPFEAADEHRGRARAAADPTPVEDLRERPPGEPARALRGRRRGEVEGPTPRRRRLTAR